MITSVIVAHKDGQTVAVKAAKGDLRAEYKALAEKGGFDQIELITSANGRVKRKTLKQAPTITEQEEPQEQEEQQPKEQTPKKKK
jgi:hypothetical protein